MNHKALLHTVARAVSLGPRGASLVRAVIGRVCHAALLFLRWLGRRRLLTQWINGLPLGGLPLVGRIRGKFLPPPVRIRSFGGSMSVPAALRIEIDGKRHDRTRPAGLSAAAKNLFDGFDPFVFNVSFACGKGTWWRGRYADPWSVWFNVFSGYYQIDVDWPVWRRPFGYEGNENDGFQVDLGEVARLGRADWNYFSNYMYGVPVEAVARYDKGTFDGTVRPGRVLLGSTGWDSVAIRGVEVASAYLARDGRGLQTHRQPFLQGLWRAAFGGPRARPGFPESFIPARMTAEILMSWRLRGDVASTLIFGATVNDVYPKLPARRGRDRERENRDFLQAQMRALRALVSREYGDAGFPL